MFVQYPKIVEYLGYDPFAQDPKQNLDPRKSNEPDIVAFFAHAHVGEHIKRRRILRKIMAKDCAKILGIDVKTLRGWESGTHAPLRWFRTKIIEFLGYDPFPESD